MNRIFPSMHGNGNKDEPTDEQFVFGLDGGKCMRMR